MMKVLLWIFVITFAIFAVFGILIFIEYLKYFKRKIQIKLTSKLKR